MFSLTNPWVILGLVLALAGAAAGGAKLGIDHEIAKQAETADLIAQVKEQAQQGAAEAIAQNRPINQYNKQVLEREIRTNTVYAQCIHTPDGLQSVNAALENKRAESTGSGVVPNANTPER